MLTERKLERFLKEIAEKLAEFLSLEK